MGFDGTPIKGIRRTIKVYGPLRDAKQERRRQRIVRERGKRIRRPHGAGVETSIRDRISG